LEGEHKLVEVEVEEIYHANLLSILNEIISLRGLENEIEASRIENIFYLEKTT